MQMLAWGARGGTDARSQSGSDLLATESLEQGKRVHVCQGKQRERVQVHLTQSSDTRFTLKRLHSSTDLQGDSQLILPHDHVTARQDRQPLSSEG